MTDIQSIGHAKIPLTILPLSQECDAPANEPDSTAFKNRLNQWFVKEGDHFLDRIGVQKINNTREVRTVSIDKTVAIRTGLTMDSPNMQDDAQLTSSDDSSDCSRVFDPRASSGTSIVSDGLSIGFGISVNKLSGESISRRTSQEDTPIMIDSATLRRNSSFRNNHSAGVTGNECESIATVSEDTGDNLTYSAFTSPAKEASHNMVASQLKTVNLKISTMKGSPLRASPPKSPQKARKKAVTKPHVWKVENSPLRSPNKLIASSPNSSFYRQTPQATRIEQFSDSFYEHPEMPMFADVLVPMKMAGTDDINSHVAGAYTIDRGRMFMSVAAPMPITDNEIVEESIRFAEKRLQQEVESLRKKTLISTISRRLFGEVVDQSTLSGQSIRHSTSDPGDLMEVLHEGSSHNISSENLNEQKFRKRQYLQYTIDPPGTTPANESTYRVVISLRQVNLFKSSKSPQGSRPDTLIYDGFASHSQAQRFAEAMVPPAWIDSTFCYICLHGFALLRKGHHCRNCGNMICSDCSSKTQPGSSLPSTYHNNEKVVRLCDCCTYLSDSFAEALMAGDFARCKVLYTAGNVNLRTALSLSVQGSNDVVYPFHLAAQGGNLDIMKWLLEDHLCPITDNGSPLKTSSGLTCLAVAAKYGNADIMKYLVSKHDAEVSEIADPKVLLTGLHAALEAPGELPHTETRHAPSSSRFNRWLGRSPSIETATTTANLITGHPNAGFLIEADVTAVIPHYSLTNSRSHTPEQGTGNNTGSTASLSRSASGSQKIFKTQCPTAQSIVENEILRIEQSENPHLVRPQFLSAETSITMPYNDEDVMDFQDYALRRSSGRSRRNSHGGTTRSSNSRGNASTYATPPRHNNHRRTVNGERGGMEQGIYQPRVLPNAYRGSARRGPAASQGERTLVTRNSAATAPPGALHVVPRSRSVGSRNMTPEQQERAVQSARRRLERARAEYERAHPSEAAH